MPARRELLLVEPQFLLRRTVAAVARELDLGRIHEAASIDGAARLVAAQRFDALMIDLDPEGEALALLARVRSGDTQCDGDIPVTAFASQCDGSTALRLKELGVRRLLIKPFKVRSVLESIQGLWPAATPAR